MGGLFLNAEYKKGELLLYFLNKNIEKVIIKDYRIAYVEPVNLNELLKILENLDFIYEINVEKWLSPPYYDKESNILKIRYLGKKEFIRKIEEKGLGISVNNYINELNLILKERGLNPGYFYDHFNKKDDEGPLYELPEIRYAYITSLNKYGKEASWYDIKYYKIKTNDNEFIINNINEIYDIIKKENIKIVMADINALNQIKENEDFILIQKPLVGIYGLIEWSRISGLTLKQASNSSIGKILTSAEILEAMRRFYLIKKVKRLEPWRSLYELERADKAGAISIPKPGIYFNVYQLDFSSLYPNIIVLNNLSAETVNNPNCLNYEIKGIGHKVCLDKEGIIPAVLRNLIKRREILRPYKNNPMYKERFDAIKWILVAGFGYLGYRNSLFGSISAYETVTSIAREIMKKSYEISIKNGYKVINFIVDSLFIIPEKPKVSIEELSEMISNEIKIKLRLEDKFIWLVFPYTQKGLGSPGKYYGLRDDGSLKIKGINAIRKNVPDIIKEAELNALEILKNAKNEKEFFELLGKAREAYNKIKEKLINNDIKDELLIINKNVNSIKKTQQVKASSYLYGLSDSISYIINYDGKPIPIDFYTGSYNKEYYLKYLERSENEMPWVFHARIP
ncbi:DNA polymerase elongation subunit (family B) [Caldisphaera lagunensis DSM 15908]|uniref:DNA-directed DNA polymerase n=1 Tax=Caldisphaera lagunensis (strain DSM 15908 / JCM 11604 / ANMR 0165 / IC-154) TaxID=1056495 RepID=L0ACN0_CALLD|nr:DNA polymerase domain-containing protein [Caldisphaera lagunensis]AFZ70815.1 DNA polymerase elongation subunit (family B) [Caldisphaera lagunensis DSM 15908]